VDLDAIEKIFNSPPFESEKDDLEMEGPTSPNHSDPSPVWSNHSRSGKQSPMQVTGRPAVYDPN
jgi:hypothetical protein